MKFSTKQEFINFIKKQINVQLENEECWGNEEKHILYTVINKEDKYNVLSLLNKYKMRYEEHLNNKYWIWVNSPNKNFSK